MTLTRASAVLGLVVLASACRTSSHAPATPTPCFGISTPIAGTINFPCSPPVSGTVVSTPSGLQYVDEVVGAGAAPAKGQLVTLKYVGWLAGGPSFTFNKEQQAQFVVGEGAFLKGVDEAVLTMRVGGRRRVLIPADLAYGHTGVGAGITQLVPADAAVLFDIQLVAIK